LLQALPGRTAGCRDERSRHTRKTNGVFPRVVLADQKWLAPYFYKSAWHLWNWPNVNGTLLLQKCLAPLEPAKVVGSLPLQKCLAPFEPAKNDWLLTFTKVVGTFGTRNENLRTMDFPRNTAKRYAVHFATFALLAGFAGFGAAGCSGSATPRAAMDAPPPGGPCNGNYLVTTCIGSGVRCECDGCPPCQSTCTSVCRSPSEMASSTAGLSCSPVNDWEIRCVGNPPGVPEGLEAGPAKTVD
jgi:hypothetical protein